MRGNFLFKFRLNAHKKKHQLINPVTFSLRPQFPDYYDSEPTQFRQIQAIRFPVQFCNLQKTKTLFMPFFLNLGKSHTFWKVFKRTFESFNNCWSTCEWQSLSHTNSFFHCGSKLASLWYNWICDGYLVRTAHLPRQCLVKHKARTNAKLLIYELILFDMISI